MARFYELFAGIGLVREALEPLGWECVYANDFDKDKQAVYAARFPDHEDFDPRNLWHVDVAKLPRPVDLIASSFPCIDLSLAGNRRGLAGEHSGAFWAFIRVLRRLREGGDEPAAVMIENVTGFLSSNEGEDFRTAVRTLNELGYRVDAVQVTAEYFTPQSRPRLFVLGVRQDLAPSVMSLPESCVRDEWRQAVLSDLSIRPRQVREMMLDGECSDQSPLLDEARERFSWGVIRFPEMPRRTENFSDIVEWEGGSWWSRERTEKALSEMAPLHQTKIRTMIEQGGRQAATAYRRRRNGRSVYEIRNDGVAGCLRTARGGSSTQIVIVAENGEIHMRWMTPREYARLQGCKYQDELDSFSDAVLRTAFGDAVCVPAVSWVTEHAFTPIREIAYKRKGASNTWKVSQL